jgi:hypothetical protein
MCGCTALDWLYEQVRSWAACLEGKLSIFFCYQYNGVYWLKV